MSPIEKVAYLADFGAAANLVAESDDELQLRRGVELLLAFVENNFIGPPREDHPAPSNTQDLCIDGELPIGKFIGPSMLVQAIQSFEKTSQWWHARALIIWQRILEGKSETLKSRILYLLRNVELPDNLDAELFAELQGRRNIELAIACNLYGLGEDSSEYIARAKDLLGFEFELKGIRGKRTKFQRKAVSQLAVVTSSKNEEIGHAAKLKPSDPTMVPLNDDQLLEETEFDIDDENFGGQARSLSTWEQALLLAVVDNLQCTHPKDAISREESLAYTSQILMWHLSYTLTTSALHKRSILEADIPRKRERSILQLDALAEQFRSCDGTDGRRLDPQTFFATRFPGHLELQIDIADRFFEFGALRSAQQTYEAVERWDRVVDCLSAQSEKEKAISLCERLLSITPNDPRILLSLGQVKEDPQLFERSWRASNNSFAKAMRVAGYHFFRKKQYEQCIEKLERALALNSLHERAWFAKGCAELHLGKWDEARESFIRVTINDPDDADAWNNLATVYIKLRKPKEAVFALKQALKEKYHSWRIWWNLLHVQLVSDSVGSDAVLAAKRVIELEPNKLELPEFSRLIFSLPFREGKELFEYYESKVSPPSRFYMMAADYFQLHEQSEAAILAVEAAWRLVIQDPRIGKDREALEHAGKVCKRLCTLSNDETQKDRAVAKLNALTSRELGVPNMNGEIGSLSCMS